MPRKPRRARLLLAPVVSLAVALGLAVLPAASAQAEPTEPTTVTISLSRPFGVYFDGVGPAIPDDTFAVTGTLKSADVGLVGETVTLYRALKTEDVTALKPIASTTTTDGGAYRFSQRVVGGAVYGVRYDGDDVHLNQDSALKALPAMRDFNAGKRRASGKLYFRGDINPGWGGRAVTLQKKACSSCAWRTVATKNAGSSGGWSFRVYYPKRVGPVWRWQAVIARSGNFEKSYSAVLTTRRAYARGAAARLG